MEGVNGGQSPEDIFQVETGSCFIDLCALCFNKNEGFLHQQLCVCVCVSHKYLSFCTIYVKVKCFPCVLYWFPSVSFIGNRFFFRLENYSSCLIFHNVCVCLYVPDSQPCELSLLLFFKWCLGGCGGVLGYIWCLRLKPQSWKMRLGL